MHQQVRLSTLKARRATAGVTADEGSVVGILTLLKKMNLRSAGRTYLAEGGEFVFSVRHEGNDGRADQRACNLLKRNKYEAKVYEVESRLLEDREGALVEYINEIETAMDEPVIEVHVLTPEPDGQVPVQLVTRSMLNR